MAKAVAFFFPGQGSQYVGMGSRMRQHPRWQEADDVLGFRLSEICFDGPDEKLKSTAITQPAILTYSMILADELMRQGLHPSCTLGHSVGEYAALTCAGVFSFADALKAVHERGKAMQDASPDGVGSMWAILRVPAREVELACQKVSTSDNSIQAANYNDPEQTVISGHIAAGEKVVAQLGAEHPRMRAIQLNVSAPFHSSLMAPAAKKMQELLLNLPLQSNDIPYIANIDAQVYPAGTPPEQIRKNLIEQVEGSVLWWQSVKQVPPETLCLEVGPGKVLTGLGRKIDSNLKFIAIDQENFMSNIQENLT